MNVRDPERLSTQLCRSINAWGAQATLHFKSTAKGTGESLISRHLVCKYDFELARAAMHIHRCATTSRSTALCVR